MPYWYYEKEDLKNSPSKRSGVDYDTEKRYRREATNFIKECGNLMGLGYSTIHTAIVYLHRFYQFHSFKTFPRFVTACACLFLAGKVEETPKKCKDIIKKASTILSAPKIASFGEDPKEEVITMERILLKTIKFDLQVDHPYRFLIEYAKSLKSNGSSISKEQVVQKAWNFINDSLETTLCLQWEPEIIAVAMMYLATKISKYDVVDWKGRLPEHQKWWDVFVRDMTKNILDEICHQVLDLYTNNKNKVIAPDSPPQTPPSKATITKYDQPPLKRQKLQQSPNFNSKVGTNQIPVKVSSNDFDLSKVPIHQYSYPGYQGQPYLMPSNVLQPPLPTYPNSQIHPPMPAMPPGRYSNNYYQQPPQQPPLPPSSNNYPPHKSNSRSSNNSNNFSY